MLWTTITTIGNNVGQLVNLADGSLAAKYEYDPYGNLLASAGPMADANPFRFSTKYCDDELAADGTAEDLYYYGYRFYSPRLGRWISRDTIGEVDHVNLYVANKNNLTNSFDPLGLFTWYIHGDITFITLHNTSVRYQAWAMEFITGSNQETDLFEVASSSAHAQSLNFVNRMSELMNIIRTHHCNCRWLYTDPQVLARVIGRSLHTLQDFYSHTDWLDGIEMIGAYRYWGDLGRFEEKARRHVRHSVLDTLDHELLLVGDKSQVFDVIYYSGGYIDWIIIVDDHAKYSADEPGAGRDSYLYYGIPYAHERAKYAAKKQTMEFLNWAAQNMDASCKPYLLSLP